MENHHFYWENSLFLWPFSIAFCMFTRGYNFISNESQRWQIYEIGQSIPETSLAVGRRESSPWERHGLWQFIGPWVTGGKGAPSMEIYPLVP